MSLHKRLLLILGGTFILLWSLAAAWLLGDLDQEVERVLDERLASSANMVAGLLEQIPAPVGPAQFSPLQQQIFGLRRGLVCQVRNLRGEVLVRTPNMMFNESEEELLGFAQSEIDGEQWRTYTTQRHNLLITTGDKVQERENLQWVIRFAAATPVLFALLGSLLLLWLGVSRGLSPLQQLRQQLARRQADDLSPLATENVPKELVPLVETLNQLLQRLEHTMQQERRFNDDAAHELRSPLTAIKTFLQVAQRAAPEQAGGYIDKAEHSVSRMQATLEQLLMLSRLGSAEEYPASSAVSCQAVMRQVLECFDADVAQQRIELELQAGTNCELAVPESLAVVAVRNLLENALRYSPSASQVQVSSHVQQGMLLVEVCDQGAGLDEEQFALAQNRFWRAQSSACGSGLGLAIVAAICQRFGGQLDASRRDAQFVVSLQLPLRNPG